jgi:hypothetical protein
MSVPDYRLKPYRVEWRAYLNTSWMRIQDCDTARGTEGSAEDVATKTRERHNGYTRIITQHIIESTDPTDNGQT